MDRIASANALCDRQSLQFCTICPSYHLCGSIITRTNRFELGGLRRVADEFDRDAVATEVQKLKADLVRFVLTDVRDNPGQAGTPALSAEIAGLVAGAVRKTLTDPQGKMAELQAELASAAAQVQQLRAGLTAAALPAARAHNGSSFRKNVNALHSTIAPADADGSEDDADSNRMDGPTKGASNRAGLGKWSLPVGAGLVAGVLATLAAQYLMPSAPATPAPVQMSVEQRIDTSAKDYSDALDVLPTELSTAGLGPDAPESVAASAIDATKREDLIALLLQAVEEADALKRVLQPTVADGSNRSITELATQADQLRAQARRLEAATDAMEPKKLTELVEQAQATALRLQSRDNE